LLDIVRHRSVSVLGGRYCLVYKNINFVPKHYSTRRYRTLRNIDHDLSVFHDSLEYTYIRCG
jgi:hypothetical protein